MTEPYEQGGLIKHAEFDGKDIESYKNKGVDYMFTVDHDLVCY